MAARFSKTILNNGAPLIGFSNHVYLVTANAAVNNLMPLTESSLNDGEYYRANVDGGYYDIYIDLDKSGTPVSGDLAAEDVYHPIPDSFVTNDMLESFGGF